MERKKIIEKIKNIFLSIERTNELSKNTKFDNKYEIWEIFGLDILKIVYGWNLEDLNVKYLTELFPGIDLGDEKNNIGVQVSVSNNATKINKTINQYINPIKNNFQKLLKSKYFNLKFFFISSSHNIQKKFSFIKEKEGFNFCNKDIITFNSLLKVIEIKSIEELKNILTLLEEYENKEIKNYFIELLRFDNYKLAKNIIKKNKIEFLENEIFIDIKKEFEKEDNSIINGNNKFNYDFEKFSETYKFILINIKRLKKKEHIKKEKLEFYKNIVNNDSYILHFFSNLGKINNERFSEIVDKIIIDIVQNNYSYRNIIVILNYLENYLNKNNEEIILKVFLDILEKAEEEFISRKIAIIFAKQKLNFSNSFLILEVLKLDIKKSQDGFASDFILEFLSKNIDKFNKFEIEEIIKLFNFEKEINKNLINIKGHGLREEKYLRKIVVKILKIDYKLAFFFFGKLLELDEDNKIKTYNGIKYIPYYKFPESKLTIKKYSSSSSNYNIFVELALELIKFSKSKNNRKLFEEIINYIIKKGEYSIYYELISFTLIENRTKNFELIEKLVKKKEILGFIKFHSKRWGLKIFRYYFNKNNDFIKNFIKNINSKKIEFALNKDALKKYFLKSIPSKFLTKEEKKYIYECEKNENKINFTDENFIKVTTGFGRPDPLIIKFKEDDNLKEVCSKIDILFEKENSFNLWDYGNEFKKYFKNNLDKIKDAYKYISNQDNKDKYIIASHLISTKIDIWKEKYKEKMSLSFYEDLIKTYNILDEEDNNSKISIGQLLDDNGFLRNDDFTGKIKEKDKKIYLGLKNIVLNLASSKNPIEDSENDGLTLGLNTARGLGTINCSILFFFYPDDKELKERIIELSYDKLYGIQATLISNMSLFLKDNYELVNEILSRYILEQNKIRDYAIVNYFFGGRIHGYGDYKELYIKIFNYLLKSEEADVQNSTGRILGVIIFSGLITEKYSLIKEYLKLLEDMIKGEKGNQNSMLGFCFAIQNNFIFSEDKEFNILINILNNYKDKKSDGKNDSIYYRLSFLFYSEKLLIERFDKIYEKGIFKLLIEKSKESGVFSNINKYLNNILENKGEIYVNKIINILKLEIDNGKDIFDEYSFNGMHKIVKEIFINFDGKNNKICNEIFERGLELGNKTYLEIFEKFYKE